MRHYTLEQCIQYAKQDSLLSVEEQAAYEAHLSTCDDCLEVYIQGLEIAAEAYPALTDEDEQEMFNSVMQRVATFGLPQHTNVTPFHELQAKSRRSPGWLRHPLFHYIVAASITLVLMSSGAFQTIIDRLEQPDKPGEAIQLSQEREENRMSVSQKIMDKTIVMLDSIQPTKHEKGGTR